MQADCLLALDQAEHTRFSRPGLGACALFDLVDAASSLDPQKATIVVLTRKHGRRQGRIVVQSIKLVLRGNGNAPAGSAVQGTWKDKEMTAKGEGECIS